MPAQRSHPPSSPPSPAARRGATTAGLRWLALGLLGLVPLAVIPYASNAAVEAIAARAAVWLQAGLSAPLLATRGAAQSCPPRASETTSDDHAVTEVNDVSSERVARVRRALPAGAVSPARRRGLSIYVGPEAVKRAIAPSARPSATWTERRAESPAGVQFTAVGALAPLVRVGDILVEVEGKPLRDLGQLLADVAAAHERRSPTVAGRVWRRGELWTVVVEPGW